MRIMKVKDIMKKKVVVCTITDSVSIAAKKMRKNNISGMPVMDGSKLVGIITEGDILRILRTPKYSKELWLPSPLELIEVPIRELVGWVETKKALENIGNMPVIDVMTKRVYTISTEDSIERGAEVMTTHDINRLPVIDGSKLVGSPDMHARVVVVRVECNTYEVSGRKIRIIVPVHPGPGFQSGPIVMGITQSFAQRRIGSVITPIDHP